MKRSLKVLLLLIFASTLLPKVPIMAGVVFPPHEDPAKAESTIDAYAFLMYYSDLFGELVIRRYQNASMLIERLKFTYIPEDLTYIIQRYNDLTLELTEILNNTENLLVEASSLLYQYRLEEASRKLNDTGILIGRAEILLKDVEEATDTISGRLGAFAAPAESSVRQAYNRLQNVLQRLRALMDEYKDLFRKLRSESSEIQMEELKATKITLNLNATRVFVGGFINASGNLTSEGEGLPNRKVRILLDGNPLTETLTSSDGSYSITVRIPHKYVEILKVEALYTPIGADRGVYLASKSLTLFINVLFYKTSVTLTVPDEAYPGLPVRVDGKITVEDGRPADSRDVEILLDQVLIAKNETNPQGIFDFEMVLGSHTSVGKHKLTFTVEPKGIYAGTSYTGELSIVKALPELSIQLPSFLVLPARLYVEGSVHSIFGPLKGSLVRLELGESSTVVKTFEDGRFNTTVNAPLNLALSGFQELRVNIEPAEPWNAPLYIKKTILIINPANISIVSVAFLSLIATLYTRLRRNRLREGVSVAPLETPLETHAAETLQLKPTIKLEGMRARILMAYLKAVEKIGAATGIFMELHMTLREFLCEAKPKLRGATDSFSELTFLAERVLYSPYMPEEDEGSKAERLVERVMEALKGGSA